MITRWFGMLIDIPLYIYLKRKINLRNFSFELLLLHIKYYLPPGQNLK